MKYSYRIALIYAVSLASAGAYAYYRGQRGNDLFRDTAVHGIVLGTGLSFAEWVLDANIAFANPSEGVKAMGTMSEGAVKLLQKLDVDTLYKPHKGNGVKIAPVPENSSLINQDET